MKNRKLKTVIFLCIGMLLLSMFTYSIYSKVNGVNSIFIINNNSGSIFYDNDKYKYVDFRIIVNEKEIFNDTLPDSMHFQKVLETSLNFGYNRIEVYSDSSRQFDIKYDFVLLKKYIHVGFTRSMQDVYNNDEYFTLYIDSSYFR